MSYGILLIRAVVGTLMAGHGAQKLFGWFDGPGPDGTAKMFRGLGFRAPMLMALLAGAAELSGAAFALGLLTPLAALAIAVVMLNAIATVHWKKGLWVTKGGFEYNLTLLATAVAVTATGPGRFSVDRALGLDGRTSGLWWAVGVLAAAIVVSALTLALGRRPEAPQAAGSERPQHGHRAAA